MTHDYKGTLDALNKWNCIDRRLNHKAREFGRDQAELFLECNLETIRSALLLAQEAEQLEAQREAFKKKMESFLEEDITRTKTVDGATVGFIYRDNLIKQLRKERDEFKELYDVMVERYTDLAKKVVGE